MSKAVVFDRFGTPDVLYVSEIENRPLNDSEILIKNSFSAVNPIDYKIRNGSSFVCQKRKGIPFPWTLGFDAAGTVIKAGPLSRFKPGDRVAAKSGDADDPHGYQEELIVRDDQAVIIPKNVGFAEAAAIITVGLTALSIIDKLPSTPGKVLVCGASGGVGHVLVQILKSKDWHVSAMCSSENLSFVKALGADDVYDYRQMPSGLEHQFVAVVDIPGDSIGIGLYPYLKDRGTLITVPTITATEVINSAPIECGVTACGVMAEYSAERLSLLLELLDEKKVRPEITAVYSPEDVKKAHESIESGHTRGKILIEF